MNRRNWMKLSGGAIAAFAANAAAWSQSRPKSPNIILFLTDDQGWTGTSSRMEDRIPGSASDYYRTPNIDKLARSGVHFSNGYAAAPVCSPTRYSIQFGQTPARLRMTQVDAEMGRKVNHAQLTIPQVLKQVDPLYRAAHFGKWGIECDQPVMGYDAGDGRTGNVDGGMSKGAGKWKGRVEEDPKKIFEITRRSVDFMEKQVREQHPFYLQISHYAVHADIVSRQQTLEKYQKLPKGKKHNMPAYAAMTEDLDTGIGQVLDKVRALGIQDNTYIFLLADNGAVPVLPPDPDVEMGQNDPLRRGKWSLIEGGLRVPFLAAGPGIKAGTQCDVSVVAWDLLPTFADLAGYKGKLPSSVDGYSLSTLLKNAGRGRIDRGAHPLVFHLPHKLGAGLGRPHSAIREGDWKLIRFMDNGQIMLFNLAEDIGEANDLAQKSPSKARELEQHLMAYLKASNAQLTADTKRAPPE